MIQNNNARAVTEEFAYGGLGTVSVYQGQSAGLGKLCHMRVSWGRHGDAWEEVTRGWRNTDSQKERGEKRSDHTHGEGLCSIQVWWPDTSPVGHQANNSSDYATVVSLCTQWSLGVFQKDSKKPFLLDTGSQTPLLPQVVYSNRRLYAIDIIIHLYINTPMYIFIHTHAFKFKEENLWNVFFKWAPKIFQKAEERENHNKNLSCTLCYI